MQKFIFGGFGALVVGIVALVGMVYPIVYMPYEVVDDDRQCRFQVEPSVTGEDRKVECGTYGELAMSFSVHIEDYQSLRD